MDTSPFDDAASASLAAIYSQQGVAATYTPNGGSPVDVTVLVDDRSREIRDKSGNRSKVHTLRGSVRVSEVAALERGDTIQIEGDPIAFKVVPTSVMNDGLEWDFTATGDVVTQLGDVQTFPNQ